MKLRAGLALLTVLFAALIAVQFYEASAVFTGAAASIIAGLAAFLIAEKARVSKRGFALYTAGAAVRLTALAVSVLVLQSKGRAWTEIYAASMMCGFFIFTAAEISWLAGISKRTD